MAVADKFESYDDLFVKVFQQKEGVNKPNVLGILAASRAYYVSMVDKDYKR